MKRDLVAVTRNAYDLLVVGGGIYGACVAWDATLRGLSVALVDKADFGSGTSANSLKIIHGGLRYLQQADFKRMRESAREQVTLMRIAPHLIHPLPVLIPAYGHWCRSKEVLSLALLVNRLIGFHRDCAEDPQKRIPRGHTLSRKEVLRLFPGIHENGLTGGAVFYDAQVYNSERLIFSILCAAEKAGAGLANYVKVTGFLKHRDTVSGVEVQDVLTGNSFHIRAKTVVNTSGPWVSRVRGLDGHWPYRLLFAKAINLVTRQLVHTCAVGISGKNHYHDTRAVIDKGARFLFFAPWRDRSLIGTWYGTYDGDADDFKVTEADIEKFLDEINQAYPCAGLNMDQISFIHGGLVPRTGFSRKTGDVQLANHYQILDHQDEGLKGLISVIGVKYTTARHVAEEVVDRVFERLRKKPPRSISAVTPVHGGRIERFDSFLQAQTLYRPYGLGEEVVRSLIYNYGCAYPEVLKYIDRELDARGTITDRLTLIRAEVLHGIRDEMAQKLTDVIFRRTELGTAGHPGHQVLRACAETMSEELGWTPTKTQQELQEVNEKFDFLH